MRLTRYAILCLVGTLLPLATFAPWVATHGLAIPLLMTQAFATPISSFAWLDVLVSGATLILFVFVEGRRIGMPRPWVALSGLVIGVSLALPLFLLLREKHMTKPAQA